MRRITIVVAGAALMLFSIQSAKPQYTNETARCQSIMDPQRKTICLNSMGDGAPRPSFDCAKAATIIEQTICSDVSLAQWDSHMGQLYRQALHIQNNSQTFIADQRRWIAQRNGACSGAVPDTIKSCLLGMTKVRVGGLAAVIVASGQNPISSPPTNASGTFQPPPTATARNAPVNRSSPPIASSVEPAPISNPSQHAENESSMSRAANAPPASSNAIPADEISFVDVVTNARQTYGQASTDFQKGATRPARAKAICSALRMIRINNWIGKVSTLSTNGDGKGVLGIEIGRDIYVQTWNNALSDIGSKTLIETDSRVFVIMGKLNKGDMVRFSGAFISRDADCVQETSMTLNGSMTSPEFLFRFSSVEP